MNAPHELRGLLCEQWCSALEIYADDSAGVRLGLPLVEADGDQVTVWLQPALGGWKVTDHGAAMMRLSYYLDLDDIAEGPRQRVIQQIMAEHAVQFAEGAIFTIATESGLSDALLRVGQAMLRVGDVALWTRQIVASAFYDDLRRELERIVGADRLERDYQVPNLPEAASYPVDYAVVRGVAKPFYIFGVPTQDKSRLATIVLQHLRAARQSFESLIVLQSIDAVPRPDLRRLMNAADSMVDSLTAQDALEAKVLQRIAA